MGAVVSDEVTAIPSEVRVRRWASVISLCVAVISAPAQTSPSEYQQGTIMGVTEHHTAGKQNTEVRQYDVSVKVGNTIFVVLLTPPSASKSVTYALGNSLLVLVGSDTLTFNRGSEKAEVPILSRELVPSQNVDWAKAPGQYFSMKLENLAEKLALTDAQRTEFKPILEQETGEVGQIVSNPVLSSADKLKQYEKIVLSSDKKLHPLLSASQRGKLQNLRNQQRQELKKLMAEQKKGKQE